MHDLRYFRGFFQYTKITFFFWKKYVHALCQTHFELTHTVHAKGKIVHTSIVQKTENTLNTDGFFDHI